MSQAAVMDINGNEAVNSTSLRPLSWARGDLGGNDGLITRRPRRTESDASRRTSSLARATG